MDEEQRMFLDESFIAEGGKLEGGIFYRDYNLVQFIKKVEEQHGKVGAITLDGNNLEIYVIKK